MSGADGGYSGNSQSAEAKSQAASLRILGFTGPEYKIISRTSVHGRWPSVEEVKNAFKKLALLHHPDKQGAALGGVLPPAGGNHGNNQLFSKVHEAYQVVLAEAKIREKLGLIGRAVGRNNSSATATSYSDHSATSSSFEAAGASPMAKEPSATTATSSSPYTRSHSTNAGSNPHRQRTPNRTTPSGPLPSATVLSFMDSFETEWAKQAEDIKEEARKEWVKRQDRASRTKAAVPSNPAPPTQTQQQPAPTSAQGKPPDHQSSSRPFLGTPKRCSTPLRSNLSAASSSPLRTTTTSSGPPSWVQEAIRRSSTPLRAQRSAPQPVRSQEVEVVQEEDKCMFYPHLQGKPATPLPEPSRGTKATGCRPQEEELHLNSSPKSDRRRSTTPTLSGVSKTGEDNSSGYESPTFKPQAKLPLNISDQETQPRTPTTPKRRPSLVRLAKPIVGESSDGHYSGASPSSRSKNSFHRRAAELAQDLIDWQRQELDVREMIEKKNENLSRLFHLQSVEFRIRRSYYDSFEKLMNGFQVQMGLQMDELKFREQQDDTAQGLSETGGDKCEATRRVSPPSKSRQEAAAHNFGEPRATNSSTPKRPSLVPIVGSATPKSPVSAKPSESPSSGDKDRSRRYKTPTSSSAIPPRHCVSPHQNSSRSRLAGGTKSPFRSAIAIPNVPYLGARKGGGGY